jgi:hypothetical protein
MAAMLNAFAIAEWPVGAAKGDIEAKGDAEMRKILLIAALSLTTAGCGAGGAKSAAEGAVTQFHQMLDAGRYHDIYAGTSPEFKNATSEAQLNALLQNIHDQLGTVGQAQEQSWHYNYNNGVTQVDLSYNTRFASGTATESFVYRIDNGRPALVNYSIHSNAAGAAGSGNTSGGDGGSGDKTGDAPAGGGGDSGGNSGGK